MNIFLSAIGIVFGLFINWNFFQFTVAVPVSVINKIDNSVIQTTVSSFIEAEFDPDAEQIVKDQIPATEDDNDILIIQRKEKSSINIPKPVNVDDLTEPLKDSASTDDYDTNDAIDSKLNLERLDDKNNLNEFTVTITKNGFTPGTDPVEAKYSTAPVEHVIGFSTNSENLLIIRNITNEPEKRDPKSSFSSLIEEIANNGINTELLGVNESVSSISPQGQMGKLRLAGNIDFNLDQEETTVSMPTETIVPATTSSPDSMLVKRESEMPKTDSKFVNTEPTMKEISSNTETAIVSTSTEAIAARMEEINEAKNLKPTLVGHQVPNVGEHSNTSTTSEATITEVLPKTTSKDFDKSSGLYITERNQLNSDVVTEKSDMSRSSENIPESKVNPSIVRHQIPDSTQVNTAGNEMQTTLATTQITTGINSMTTPKDSEQKPNMTQKLTPSLVAHQIPVGGQQVKVTSNMDNTPIMEAIVKETTKMISMDPSGFHMTEVMHTTPPGLTANSDETTGVSNQNTVQATIVRHQAPNVNNNQSTIQETTVEHPVTDSTVKVSAGEATKAEEMNTTTTLQSESNTKDSKKIVPSLVSHQLPNIGEHAKMTSSMEERPTTKMMIEESTKEASKSNLIMSDLHMTEVMHTTPSGLTSDKVEVADTMGNNSEKKINPTLVGHQIPNVDNSTSGVDKESSKPAESKPEQSMSTTSISVTEMTTPLTETQLLTKAEEHVTPSKELPKSTEQLSDELDKMTKPTEASIANANAGNNNPLPSTTSTSEMVSMSKEKIDVPKDMTKEIKEVINSLSEVTKEMGIDTTEKVKEILKDTIDKVTEPSKGISEEPNAITTNILDSAKEVINDATRMVSDVLKNETPVNSIDPIKLINVTTLLNNTISEINDNSINVASTSSIKSTSTTEEPMMADEPINLTNELQNNRISESLPGKNLGIAQMSDDKTTTESSVTHIQSTTEGPSNQLQKMKSENKGSMKRPQILEYVLWLSFTYLIIF